MNPPVGSSKRLRGIGRLRAILLLAGMSSLAARGESNRIQLYFIGVLKKNGHGTAVGGARVPMCQGILTREKTFDRCCQVTHQTALIASNAGWRRAA